MSGKGDVLDESAFIISEIESNLEKSLRRRREDLARGIRDRSAESGEAEPRIGELDREAEQSKALLGECKDALFEFEEARGALESRIRAHYEKCGRIQQEIERLSGLAAEEMRQAGLRSAEAAALRRSAEKRILEILSQLRDQLKAVPPPKPPALPAEPPSEAPPAAEIRPPAPAVEAEDEVAVNLERELSNLKRIKELLEAEPSPRREPAVPERRIEPEPAPAAEAPKAPIIESPMEFEAETAAKFQQPEIEPAAEPAPAEAPAEEQAAPAESVEPAEPESPESEPEPPPTVRPGFNLSDISRFFEEFMKKERGLSGAAPEPRPAERAPDAAAPPEEKGYQDVFEWVDRYRRTETVDGGGEISFFINGEHAILDGESLMRTMVHFVGEGRKIFARITPAVSPKDQFFLKQELINNQEALRKVILRGVRAIERENGRVPRFTEDIFSLRILQDLLERLNMENWSNPDEFVEFEAATARLREAFTKRITPPLPYLRSIMGELEA